MDLTNKMLVHVTIFLSLDSYLNIVFNDIFLVTCIKILLVKFKVKVWHKILRGLINQDGGIIILFCKMDN